MVNIKIDNVHNSIMRAYTPTLGGNQKRDYEKIS